MKTVATLFLVLVVAAQAQAILNLIPLAFTLFTKAQTGMKLAQLVLTAIEQAQVESELSWAQRAITAAARTRCRSTEKMSQDEEDLIRANNFTSLSHQQQCFIKCVSDSFRFADATIDLLDADVSAIEKILDPLVADKNEDVINNKCDDLKGANDCESAALQYKCYWDANAIHLI